MTVVSGLNQYLDHYKLVVPAGYDHNYMSIIIKNSSKDSFRINSTIINMDNIVCEENGLIGYITYNVRLLRIKEGEITASSVSRERFGLMIAGISHFVAYGFSGNSMIRS